MNELRVDVLDIVALRLIILCIFSATLAKVTGQKFTVPKQDRRILAFRSLLGAVGYACFTYGVSMVSLVIIQIIFNMAPFWTYFMDWALLGETSRRHA